MMGGTQIRKNSTKSMTSYSEVWTSPHADGRARRRDDRTDGLTAGRALHQSRVFAAKKYGRTREKVSPHLPPPPPLPWRKGWDKSVGGWKAYMRHKKAQMPRLSAKSGKKVEYIKEK